MCYCLTGLYRSLKVLEFVFLIKCAPNVHSYCAIDILKAIHSNWMHWRLGIEAAAFRPESTVDERMRSDHWLGSVLLRFLQCCDIYAWMGSNRLKMNADKTQLIWLGTKQQLDKLYKFSTTELSLLSAKVTFSSTVYDLSFLLDSQLTTKDHVSALCRSCFWQLRQL